MSDNGEQGQTLAWPSHDAGPTPPEGYGDDRERATRRPLGFWDRIKFLLLISGLWVFLFWKDILEIQKLPEAEGIPIGPILAIGFEEAVARYWWLLLLGVVEVVRQIHYLISERSAAYHRLWSEGIFGGLNRRAAEMNDWNRYRLSRVVKWLFWLVVLDLVLAAVYDVHPAVAIFRAPVAFFSALPLVVQVLFYAAIIVLQFAALFWFLSKGGVDVYFPEDVKTRFSDVWGQDHVLDKVKENIIYLERPEAIEEKGGFIPAGILLWGPPGTGKTLMAEAVAGETGKPFVFVEPGAFTNMFIGVGILKVKSLFRRLRKLALKYGGVIAFLDEADSLGNRGMAVAGTGGWSPGMAGSSPWSHDPSCHGLSYLSPASRSLVLSSGVQPADQAPPSGLVNKVIAAFGGGGGGMGTLQALLAEISGLKKPRGFVNRRVRRALGMRPKPPPKYRILFMLASNTPQVLDPALLRPGRIDRIYKVGYPSKAGRVRTYEGYFSKVRHSLTSEQIDRLATITPYATGASIKDLVNESLINSVREGRQYITWQDVIKARLLKALGPAEDVEYIERERHAVAIHEACHAVVAYRVRRHLMIDIATIEKGQDYLGMVASIPLEEQFTRWRTEYEADLMVALAAIVGEKMFFDGDNSSGVMSDLNSATTVAMLMDGYWGMGDTVASHLAAKPVAAQQFNDVSRNVLETEWGRRIEQRLDEIVHRTRELMEKNRHEILAVAHALETHKTLTGDDVIAVIEGHVGPLVDGRPYRTPQFREMAEQYHLKAVAAHKGHSKVEVPLPVLAGASSDPNWTSEALGMSDGSDSGIDSTDGLS